MAQTLYLRRRDRTTADLSFPPPIQGLVFDRSLPSSGIMFQIESVVRTRSFSAPLLCSLRKDKNGAITRYRPASLCSSAMAFSSRTRFQLVGGGARTLQTITFSSATMRSKEHPDDERVMCILDFDETITERDSSEWVAEQFSHADLFKDLRESGMPWHDAMNHVLGLLHAEGISISAIQCALWDIPLHPNVVPTLRLAREHGCELRILSDANTFFINTVLEHHAIRSLFSGIHSNPAWVDVEGRLRYRALANADHSLPLTSANSHNEKLPSLAMMKMMMMMPPHSCPHCPPNLCKGDVLDTLVNGGLNHAARHYDRAKLKIVYVGDGSGDYCPSLRLHAHDVTLPRQGYPLDKLLRHNAAMVAAQVRPWTSLSVALHHSILAS